MHAVSEMVVGRSNTKIGSIFLHSFIRTFTTFVVVIIANTHACDTNCIFPFQYNDKTHTKCTTFDSDYPWCITNPPVFWESKNWIFPNGTKAGWQPCDSSCDTEKDEYVREKCNTSKCQFPFSYGNHIYHKCTTIDFSHSGWCVTNQSSFDAGNQKFHLSPVNATQIGFQVCSSLCPFEHKVCKECENQYYYKKRKFTGCITIDSDIWDKEQKSKVPWCIVNQTSYDLTGELGWDYCSWECTAGTQNKANTTESKVNTPVILIIVACVSVPSGALVLCFSFYKILKYKNAILISSHVFL